MLDVNSTSPEIRRLQVSTVVIPLGSIEQHGEALPVGVDLVIASAIAEKVAEKLGAYLLPGVPFGTCQEHTGGTGSVWVQPSTYIAYLQDMCLSLRESGFRRIAFILGHGGLWAAKPAFRQLNMTYDDVSIVHVCPADAFISDVATVIETSPSDDVHAGEYETSLMLYLSPGGVHLDRAQDSIPAVGRALIDCVPVLEISPTGVWGRPSLGTREKGERLFELMVKRTAEYLSHSFREIERIKAGRASR